MSQFRKKPVVISASQWHKNGDHPEDKVGETLVDPMGGPNYERLEGAIVRFFRHPDRTGTADHKCGRTWNEHGWIDTLEGGHTVCPGDWIVTGVQGERYPCKPDIFSATYEPEHTEEDYQLVPSWMAPEAEKFMDEERFALEVREAFELEREATGQSDDAAVIRVAARVAANYGLVIPSTGGGPLPDDPSTTEF